MQGINNFSTDEEAIAINGHFYELIREGAAHFIENPGVFISVQDTGGDFGLSGKEGIRRAWSGGISALTKTAATEWPNVYCKAIDIQCTGRSPQEIASQLCEELFFGGVEIEVGLTSKQHRLKIDTKPEFLTPEEPFLPKQGDVWIITGGARGITAECLKALSRQIKLRLAILGRSDLFQEPEFLAKEESVIEIRRSLLDYYTSSGKKVHPQELKKEADRILSNRAIQSNLKILRELGAEVQYHSIDVRNISLLQALIQKIRQAWGPIRGIVHGAGVVADKKMHEKTLEQFYHVLETKVKGFYNLLWSTKEDPLTHICCFASVSGRFGTIGQVDYAMGNEILNKVCDVERLQRGNSCLVKSINWGLWQGGIVSSDLQDYFRSQGHFLLPIETGAKIFVEEMSYNGSTTEIVIGERVSEVFKTKNAINFDLWVDQKAYPFILSHQIRNVPVVPVVLAQEWFLRAAALWRPTIENFICHNLRVINGIKLPHFTQKGTLLHLKVEEKLKESIPLLHCSLWGDNGIKHYEATLQGHPEGSSFPFNFSRLHPDGLSSWNRTSAQIYDLLFTGKELQMIHQVEKISKNGAIAILKPSTHLSGVLKRGISPLLVFDGGLQVAVLWIWEQTKKYALPMGFLSAFFLKSAPRPGTPIKCELVCTTIDELHARIDILFMDASDQPFSLLSGVDFFLTTNNTKGT